MNKKELLVTVYLKSGNHIEIKDDFDNINPKKTLDYFEQIISKIKDISTLTTESVVGYFRYGGVLVMLSQIEALVISDEFYRECGVLSASGEVDEYDRNIRSVSYISNETPKTNGEYTEGLVILGE